MALSVRAASNLFISVVGAGVLGLPYAFKRSGLVLGIVVMIVIAALNLHCMLLLVINLCSVCKLAVCSYQHSCLSISACLVAAAVMHVLHEVPKHLEPTTQVLGLTLLANLFLVETTSSQQT